MGMHVARWLVLVQLPRGVGCLAKGSGAFCVEVVYPLENPLHPLGGLLLINGSTGSC